jgi:hypothetical protein
MSLNLNLMPELEQRLAAEANRRGVSAAECAVRLLDQCLPPSDRAAAVEALVQSWIQEGDEQEQAETGAYLIRALDEDRMSDRKLFPPELEGQSW